MECVRLPPSFSIHPSLGEPDCNTIFASMLKGVSQYAYVALVPGVGIMDGGEGYS